MARTQGAKDLTPRKKAELGSKPSDSSPVIRDNNPDLPMGYNTRRIQFMQAILPTEPLDINDVEEMERRFARYLELCALWDMKVGNMAAYAAIGIDKSQAFEWVNRVLGNPERTNFIKKVQKVCAMYREGLMEDGKVNPVTGIFWQKNYDGMRDQQEVVFTPNNPLGDSPSAESMKQRYLENTYGIAESEVPMIAESAESKNSEVAEGAESNPVPATITQD